MYTVLLILGSCWLPSRLWVISLSPSCASSFRLRLLSWFQVLRISASLSSWFVAFLFFLQCHVCRCFIISLGCRWLVPIHLSLSTSASGLSLLFLGLDLSCLGGLCTSYALGYLRPLSLALQWVLIFRSGFFLVTLCFCFF